MNIYTNKGYLDQEKIAETADRKNISFVVEIGGRQIGKTYGMIEYVLGHKKRFIWMRRTMAEADFINNGINSPFSIHRNYDVRVKKDSQYTGAIQIGDEYAGAVMALTAVAKVRGFAGEQYSDLIFDEFIPETHVMRIRNEGDAFLNAVVTISGNRELNDEKPLRVWLLANSNNLNSPILDVLGLTEKVESMRAAGQELSILEERGIMVVLPHSEELMQRREKTALFRAIDKESAFGRMALQNEFAYNDNSNIRAVPIGEYRPIFCIGGLYYYRHKSDPQYYVTTKKGGSCTEYADTERGRKQLLTEQPNIRSRFIKGRTWFSTLTVKEKFINILNG